MLTAKQYVMTKLAAVQCHLNGGLFVDLDRVSELADRIIEMGKSDVPHTIPPETTIGELAFGSRAERGLFRIAIDAGLCFSVDEFNSLSAGTICLYLSDDIIMRQDNMGQTTLAEIKRALGKCGLLIPNKRA